MQERQHDTRQKKRHRGRGLCAVFRDESPPSPAQQQMLPMPPAIERYALVSAPAGQQHAHALRRGAPLHRFLVHVCLDAGQGDIATQDGQDVPGLERAVERLQALLFGDGTDQSVFPCMLRTRGRVTEFGKPREGGRQRTVSAPQFPGGEHRDAGRIQAAAQMHPHGAAVQAVAHRLGVEVEKLLRIGVVRRGLRQRRLLGMPVPLASCPEGGRSFSGPLRLDRERMPRRQLAHRFEERAGVGAEHLAGQIGGHRRLVERIGDARCGEHRFHGTGEDDPLPLQGIVERPDADVVPGAEQHPLAHVPHGEGIVAEQMRRTRPAPAQIGAQDQGAVTDGDAFGVGNAEDVAERIAVVEPGIRGQDEAGVMREMQPGGGSVFFRLCGPDREADGALRPRRRVGTVIGKGRGHGIEPLRGVTEESADRRHRVLPVDREQAPSRSRKERRTSSDRKLNARRFWPVVIPAEAKSMTLIRTPAGIQRRRLARKGLFTQRASSCLPFSWIPCVAAVPETEFPFPESLSTPPDELTREDRCYRVIGQRPHRHTAIRGP